MFGILLAKSHITVLVQLPELSYKFQRILERSRYLADYSTDVLSRSFATPKHSLPSSVRIVQSYIFFRPLFISKILRSFVLRRNIEDSKRRTVSDDINGNFESLTKT